MQHAFHFRSDDHAWLVTDYTQISIKAWAGVTAGDYTPVSLNLVPASGKC